MSFRQICFGDQEADTLLVQMVDDHDLEVIESEVSYIQELTGGQNFCLRGVKVNSWNYDLSPWPAEAVFGNEGFGGELQTHWRLCGTKYCRTRHHTPGFILADILLPDCLPFGQDTRQIFSGE